jgi:hypothetical protein
MFRQLNYTAIEDHLREHLNHISNWENDVHKYALFQVAATGMCNKITIQSEFKINYSFFRSEW